MGQWIFIQAHDVWMFRDSKPFTAQQTFNAKSQFPPNPQTMQGVIRSHYLEAQKVDWHAYAQGNADASLYRQVGNPAMKKGHHPPSMGNLYICGPFVARRLAQGVEQVIPAPLDLVYHATDKQYDLLTLTTAKTFLTSGVSDDWKPLYAPSGYKHHEGIWLSQSQFAMYLKGDVPTGEFIAQDTLFTYEDRIGLGLDYAKRKNEEGLLYRAKFVRPHDDVGVLVHINQDFFSGSGYVRIGGESRSGRYQVVDKFSPPKNITSGNLKVVLMTPAYFKNGWYPERDWSHWVGQGNLVSAVIGKPLAISGWDVAHNRPKPLRHYVPTGSVYYFENATWQNKPFTESPLGEAEFDQMGFGCVAVGTYK